MIISKYNIRYIRLQEEDIELVRKWRNHPSITKYMVYREEITPEMQKKWFASINNNEKISIPAQCYLAYLMLIQEVRPKVTFRRNAFP